MAILDSLAGRPNVRKRWLGGAPPASIAKSYRFKTHRRIFLAVEHKAAASVRPRRRPVTDRVADHFARGLEAERSGNLSLAVEELEAALASSSNGAFDCVIAWALHRIHRGMGADRQANDACERILHP